MKKIFEKLLSLLRVRATAAGLEVSDQVVRLVYFDRKVWQMYAIRLEPGVVENGRIRERAAFVAVLAALKEKVRRKDKKRINIVLCVGSADSYTQTFMLPMVQGEELEKAVALNLQMASPLPEGEAYAGWQIIGKGEKSANLQILSAFTERKMVDEMVDALFEAGFLVMAVESRALALTRVLSEKGAGIDIEKSYIFVSIDNTGVDFLIVRNGMLHFEYADPWRNFTNEKGEIPAEKFEELFKASVRQVVNFYEQHWTEPLHAVILSAVALEAEAERAIAEVAPVPAAKLTLVMGQPISSEWLVALGCSLRGAGAKAEAHEISLLGEDAEDKFHKEQLVGFMKFWRVVLPVSLGLLVLMFVVANVFLMDMKGQIESRSDFNVNNEQASAITSLEASAQDFNRSVALVAAAEHAASPKSALLEKIIAMADASHVTVNHLSFTSFGTPVSLSGTAAGEDSVTAFKAALEGDPSLSAINLPLTAIQTIGRTITFSVTFIYTPTPQGPASP